MTILWRRWVLYPSILPSRIGIVSEVGHLQGAGPEVVSVVECPEHGLLGIQNVTCSLAITSLTHPATNALPSL